MTRVTPVELRALGDQLLKDSAASLTSEKGLTYKGGHQAHDNFLDRLCRDLTRIEEIMVGSMQDAKLAELLQSKARSDPQNFLQSEESRAETIKQFSRDIATHAEYVRRLGRSLDPIWQQELSLDDANVPHGGKLEEEPCLLFRYLMGKLALLRMKKDAARMSKLGERRSRRLVMSQMLFEALDAIMKFEMERNRQIVNECARLVPKIEDAITGLKPQFFGTSGISSVETALKSLTYILNQWTKAVDTSLTKRNMTYSARGKVVLGQKADAPYCINLSEGEVVDVARWCVGAYVTWWNVRKADGMEGIVPSSHVKLPGVSETTIITTLDKMMSQSSRGQGVIAAAKKRLLKMSLPATSPSKGDLFQEFDAFRNKVPGSSPAKQSKPETSSMSAKV